MTRNAMITSLLTLGLLVTPGLAGVVATNATVGSTMDAGGTSADPAVYLYDAYTGSFSGYAIGQGTGYNEFHIYNGSSFSATGLYSQKRLGNGSDHNAIRVDASSYTTTTSGYSLVGANGNYNTFAFTNGATGTFGTFYLGGNGWSGQTETGSYNQLLVDGNGTTLSTPSNGYLLLGCNAGSHNSLVISNGGQVDYSASSRVYVGYSGAASSNDISVTGFDSQFITARARVGSSDTSSNDNSLTAANSGLIKLGSSGITFGAGTGNCVRLAAGFVAVSGNDTGELVDGDVLVWNGSAYVSGTKGVDWTATYYGTEAEALAATGYDGLGGYTIFTGGSAIPEPATMSLFAVGGALALLRRRK